MSRNFTILIAGIIIGILIAPEKGSILRKRLSDFMDDFSRKAEEHIDNASGKIKQVAESLENKFEDKRGDAKRFS